MATELPPGWRTVKLGDVLPEQMIAELVKDYNAGTLTEKRLRELCQVEEYAAFMREHDLLPSFAVYWLQANLGIWR